MSVLSEYFFSVAPAVVRLQLLEISHPSFAETFRVVRNHGFSGNINVEHEDGEIVQYQHYPLRIEEIGSDNSLDQELNITLGDLGSVIPIEIERCMVANTMQTKPVIKYREYISDNYLMMAIGDPDWTFDGINDVVSFGNVLGYERTDAHSYSFWFKTASILAGYVFFKQDPAAVRQGPAIFLQTTGQIFFNLNNGTAGTNDMSTRTDASFNDGTFHHCVVTYGGGGGTTVNFYVDGVLVPMTIVQDSLSTSILNTEPMMIGNDLAGFPFAGDLHDLAQWTVELTAGDAAAIHSAGIGADYSTLGLSANPVQLIRLDDDDSDAIGGVIDYGSGGNDGTASGGIGANTGILEPVYVNPVRGPFTLEINTVALNKQGATFSAKPPSFNRVRTGEYYTIERFPMLKGFL